MRGGSGDRRLKELSVGGGGPGTGDCGGAVGGDPGTGDQGAVGGRWTPGRCLCVS